MMLMGGRIVSETNNNNNNNNDNNTGCNVIRRNSFYFIDEKIFRRGTASLRYLFRNVLTKEYEA